MDSKNFYSEKVPITKEALRKSLLLVICISAIVVFIYGILFCKNDLAKLFEYAPNVLGTIFTIVFGYLGVEVLRNRFYSSKYGRRKLKKIIVPIIKKYENYNPQVINQYIDNLQKDREKEYFPTVDQLQSSDSDFNKIWNDFNYFSHASDKKEKMYWEELKKCVYIKIYEYRMKQEKCNNTFLK